MHASMRWLALLAALLLSACESSEFLPEVGPFSGEFRVAGADIGDLSFTTTNGLVGGTGSIMHQGAVVNVAVSAVISGKSISGTVSNTDTGSGAFSGAFQNMGHAAGTFSFTDELDRTTEGTWSASALP